MSYTQYSQYGGNPYNDAPNMEGGQDGYGNHLAQPPIEHEMSNLSAASQYSHGPAQPSSGILSQNDFLGQVGDIDAGIAHLAKSITDLSNLHQKALESRPSSTNQIDKLEAQIQSKNRELRDAIKMLEADASRTRNDDTSMKKAQVNKLKKSFEARLRDYQQAERSYVRKYEEVIKRDYRNVFPNATEDEVNHAADMDWGNEGVFQAALKSNRSGQSTSTLGNVRARHNELQQIEKSLTELAAMFADMAQIVEVQEHVVQQTEENADQTQLNVDRGNVEINKASEHARRRRRLKWWCFLVVVLIILAVALGVGLGVGLAAKATKTA